MLTNKTKYNLLAKEFLYKANETNFPKEMQKQNKLFVLEKIAQLNIIEKKYHNAIVLLEPHYKKNKFFPDYAAYTLAVSYILDKKHKAAEELIDIFLNKQNSNLNHKFLKLKQQLFSEIYVKNKNIELILKPYNQ
ncbi:MAG: hypothetical protein NZM09_12255 [Ignavibacterium sp.]|nr:hypothetical protein [Ignavibacterium sp.]MDW8376447.1 hypothetical protein [Ignavibacteriales bacterium]